MRLYGRSDDFRRRNTSRSGASRKHNSLRIPRRCLSTRSSGWSMTRRWRAPGARGLHETLDDRSPYFDSQLDPFALLPDLTPDRVRVMPHASEASGLELSMHQPISDSITGWGTLAWSRVADEFRASDDVLRSWDQPLAANAGIAWKGASASLSALAGGIAGGPGPCSMRPRRQWDPGMLECWSDYYTLDIRGSWTWEFATGDLSVVLDLTNVANRRNECCSCSNRKARRSPRKWNTGCRSSSISGLPTASSTGLALTMTSNGACRITRPRRPVSLVRCTRDCPGLPVRGASRAGRGYSRAQGARSQDRSAALRGSTFGRRARKAGRAYRRDPVRCPQSLRREAADEDTSLARLGIACTSRRAKRRSPISCCSRAAIHTSAPARRVGAHPARHEISPRCGDPSRRVPRWRGRRRRHHAGRVDVQPWHFLRPQWRCEFLGC